MSALLPLLAGHTRGDCGTARPCAWACRYRLDHGPFSCALDAADDGPLTLEEVGHALGVTRERARQIEKSALRRLLGRMGAQEIDLALLRDD